MDLTVHVWRQKSGRDQGGMVTYPAHHLTPDMSILELLDQINEELISQGSDPVAFDHDCREGICGSCSMVINGVPHGPEKASTTCQTFLRSFLAGDHLYLEPFRAAAFPIVKDLMVDRSAFDRIIQAGGFVSVNTGAAPEGNAIAIAKTAAEEAMDAAACIGCGACVAACKNASAMLFTAAKVSHLALLPQGSVERGERVRRMVAQMDAEQFGSCSNQGACSAVCPKEISLDWIAKLNRETLRSQFEPTRTQSQETANQS
jgi:succinate dehydrogenase / fumarate reductase, iron-sulfur subunit